MGLWANHLESLVSVFLSICDTDYHIRDREEQKSLQKATTELLG